MQKKLLILGGARYAVPVIEAAHQLGAKAYTCDYLPNNTAHAFSDGYINASVVNASEVVAAAESIDADGIMSFACDPGVVSAAYAAERLGLPFQGSYESVSILQDKEQFRTFLNNNGFNCPGLYVFSSASEAMERASELPYPLIAKPVDSAGSKGCSRVESPRDLRKAVEYALSFSRTGRCIVEQFLEKAYASSDSDAFLINGKFECISFTSQLFDSTVPNPYTPAAYAMPAAMPQWAQTELKSELQRLATKLNLKDGIFNVETRVATDGKAYIMECSPRGGGNRLAEMLRFATKGRTDLVRAAVEAALGMPVECAGEASCDGFWYQQVLHSSVSGRFEGIAYPPGFEKAHVVEEQIWINKGDQVNAFSAANEAFGSIMLHFDSIEEMETFEKEKDAIMRVILS